MESAKERLSNTPLLPFIMLVAAIGVIAILFIK